MTDSDSGRAVSIGIDVGGTKVLGVALTAEGSVVSEHRVPTPAGAEELISSILDVVGVLDALAGSTELPVGVGAPGMVTRTGEVLFAPNLAGAHQLALARLLAERLPAQRRVVVDNDATCAGWGEAVHGAARGAGDAVVVTLGTGIGGGIISGGGLLRGANGFAGEIGHMVIDPSGPICPCGRAGCWERYASGSGLGRLARDAAHAGRSARLVELAGGDPESVRGEHVTQAAGEGDAGALEVMDRFSWWLAAGLANLANAFDPAVIVIGGGLVEAGEILMGPTRRDFLALVEAGSTRPGIDILPAALGERAGAIGAAALARG
ncbi:MAG TPA: ROK family protein [Acidimicrobiales bacterium]|nr:ROK family protein [Acidimicrobiales bacterium]